MNFEKLNRIIFLKENINNDYTRWDVGKKPRFEYEDLTESDYKLIIQSKTQIDQMVYDAVLEYLNDENLCNTENDFFPRSDFLTGNYYISDEIYSSFEDVIYVTIFTRFTEMYCGGVIKTPTEQDYLGLEVNLFINKNGVIEIDGINSSSI